MVGDKYSTSGIVVRFLEVGLWSAEINFVDEGFANEASTEGTLRTSRFIDLAQAIDIIIADAERLGIRWRWKAICTYKDSRGYWFSPYDGGELVKAQAERVGFEYVEFLERL